MTSQRTRTALLAYAVLAMLAAVTIDEKRIRAAVWVLMGGLALKTLVAAQQLRAQHAAEATQRGDANEVDGHEQQDR
jgi:hypothetical protein